MTAFVVYSIVGFFGYVTFADRKHELKKTGNILMCDYKHHTIFTLVIEFSS